MIRDR